MAVKLNGTDQGYSATAAVPNASGGDFTILTWYYVHAVNTGSFQNISYIGNSDGTSEMFLEQDDLSAVIDIGSGGGGGASVTSSTSITAGNWYRVAVTVSGTTASLFVAEATGAMNAPDTGTWGDVATPANFRIGHSGSTCGGEVTQGRFAAFKQYNRALPDHKVEREFNQYLPVETNTDVGRSLVRWLPFLDPASATIDFSGDGNDMTVTGTPTLADGPPIPWSLHRGHRIEPAGVTSDVARRTGGFLSLLG